MEINYDKDADAMYIKFRSGDFAQNKKVDDFTILDFDKKGNVIGIELLNISKRMPKKSFSEVHIKNMLAITE